MDQELFDRLFSAGVRFDAAGHAHSHGNGPIERELPPLPPFPQRLKTADDHDMLAEHLEALSETEQPAHEHELDDIHAIMKRIAPKYSDVLGGNPSIKLARQTVAYHLQAHARYLRTKESR